MFCPLHSLSLKLSNTILFAYKSCLDIFMQKNQSCWPNRLSGLSFSALYPLYCWCCFLVCWMGPVLSEVNFYSACWPQTLCIIRKCHVASFAIIFNMKSYFIFKVSSDDSNESEFHESAVSEEVSESEDEQRPRTRYK